MSKSLSLLLSLSLLAPAVALSQQEAYRFVIIPKVVHPWYDLVNQGAHQASAMIEQQTGKKVLIDYQAPHQADITEQNRLLAQAIAAKPTGIAIDLLDDQVTKSTLEAAIQQGVPVVLFDSEPPTGLALTYIGNDFCEQAQMAARRLVELMGGQGEVAIMQGVPTAVNHRLRAECHERLLQQHPEMKLVAKGIDNDSIATAHEQAKAIMAEHPQLQGWLSCDAGGGIGIAQAIQEANKVGAVFNVALDDLPETIQLIQEGVIDSAYATKPRTQGYWAVVALWQAQAGAPLPQHIDTGIGVVSQANAAHYQGK